MTRGELILYTAEDGGVSVQLRAEEGTVWLSQADMAELFQTTPQNITMLIKTIYFKDHKDFGGGIIRPSVIETDSPLYKGYKSIMIYAKIKKRTFKDEVFTQTFMPNIESLR